MAFKTIACNNLDSMHYAIIAAGDGSRLVSEGVKTPKPLIPVSGVPMIGRLMEIFAQNNAESISVIVNSGMTEVQDYLREWSSAENLLRLGVGKFTLVVESTPSSMHSFYRLSETLESGYVCLTTVDTIFKSADFSRFINSIDFNKDGLFAVTPFVDDEKPLYVNTENSRIVGFFDQGSYEYVSGGIYCLKTEKALPILKNCIEQGISRMRNYQRALVEAGLDIEAYVFPKIMDIDHKEDIAKAEAYLSDSEILCVARGEEFSPNNIEKDRKILSLVAQRLNAQIISESDFLAKRDFSTVKAVVGMERRLKSLIKLQTLPVKSYNSARGIINTATSRELTFTLLNNVGVPVPRFWAFDPEEDEMFMCEDYLQNMLPAWVKAMRHDGCRENDVVYVETPIQADSEIIRLSAEQAQDIIVMSHVEGDLVKVYAIVSRDGKVEFLRWFYPQLRGYSKFGETSKDPIRYHHFEEAHLQDLVAQIAKTLDIQFFGIDVVVEASGEIKVIDVNDWPSYSICQNEAAEAIASTILVDIETC